MIQKYVYGHPFPTDAVVKEIETAKESPGRFSKRTTRAVLPIRLRKTTLYTVWANRSGASTSVAGSMSAGTMTTPTTTRTPVRSTARTILSLSAARSLSVHFSIIPERWSSTSAIPGETPCRSRRRKMTSPSISSPVKTKRISSSSSVGSSAEVIFRRSGHSATDRAAGVIKMRQISGKSLQSTRLPAFPWTASIWTSTTWSATRTSPWMKSVSRI